MPDIMTKLINVKDRNGKHHSICVTYVRVSGSYRMLPEDWMTVSHIINGGNV